LGHVAAQQKQSLGWLAASNVQQVEAGGTFTLAHYEQTTAALHARRIPRGDGNNRWLDPVGLLDAVRRWSLGPL